MTSCLQEKARALIRGQQRMTKYDVCIALVFSLATFCPEAFVRGYSVWWVSCPTSNGILNSTWFLPRRCMLSAKNVGLIRYARSKADGCVRGQQMPHKPNHDVKRPRETTVRNKLIRDALSQSTKSLHIRFFSLLFLFSTLVFLAVSARTFGYLNTRVPDGY